MAEHPEQQSSEETAPAQEGAPEAGANGGTTPGFFMDGNSGSLHLERFAAKERDGDDEDGAFEVAALDLELVVTAVRTAAHDCSFRGVTIDRIGRRISSRTSARHDEERATTRAIGGEIRS